MVDFEFYHRRLFFLLPIFYGLVQMIRWLFMLGFNSVCFYDTRNRLQFYLKNNNDDYQNNYLK